MMKSFKQFILEARGGRASDQAIRAGLVSDGHGGWVNRQGTLIAKTEKDRLVFIKATSPNKEEPEQETQPPLRVGAAKLKVPKKPELLPKQRKPKKQEPVPKKKKSRSVTVVFAKFNPPTEGHYQLLKKAREVTQGDELRIYPSRIQNEQNPLDPKNKVRYMRIAYPDFADEIMNDSSMSTIFDVLSLLHDEGYENVRMVVGAQRESEFDRLSKQYNGKYYQFKEIEVVPANIKDPDSDASDIKSSGTLRKAAISDDYFKFKGGLPTKMPEKEKRNLFYAVRRYYEKSGPIKEAWRVAPELDHKAMCESYYRGDIFNIGDIVENQTTGIKGIIRRRGPNYVICVNEEMGLMFKPWIQDICEWTNDCGTTEKEKEVGTFERLKYVMRMAGMKKIDNYIKMPKKSKYSK